MYKGRAEKAASSARRGSAHVRSLRPLVSRLEVEAHTIRLLQPIEVEELQRFIDERLAPDVDSGESRSEEVEEAAEE